MIVPADHYRPSARVLRGRREYPGLDYPAEWERPGSPVRRDQVAGRRLFISEVLSGEPIAFQQVAELSWMVRFGPMLIGMLEGGEFAPAHPQRKMRRSGRVSQMS
ncbi:MAG TPA: hypothetical protein VK939_05325 [Longimicrobiales bacterium]|nr:hypothetical protein [Longimicrobiales bacterium]